MADDEAADRVSGGGVMPRDPSTGLLTRSEFAEAVAAPAGKAKEMIRQVDPLWGREPGEKFEWLVKVRRSGMDRGRAFVMAASQEEADDLADELDESDIDWDYFGDGFEVESVEPKPPALKR